MNVRSTKD